MKVENSIFVHRLEGPFLSLYLFSTSATFSLDSLSFVSFIFHAILTPTDNLFSNRTYRKEGTRMNNWEGGGDVMHGRRELQVEWKKCETEQL